MTQDLALQTAVDRLTFDPESGRLASVRPLRAPGVELVVSDPEPPVFVVQ